MLEPFVDPVIAFIIYLLSTIACFVVAYMVVNRKTNRRLFIGAIFMSLSIMSLVLTLHNIAGGNKELAFLVPMGAIVWGFICLGMLQERYGSSR